MKRPFILLAGILLVAGVRAQETNTLKAAFKNNFLVGAALNPSQFCESNEAEAAIVKAQFNSISPENALKWEAVHPRPGQYDFSLADRYVDFGTRNQMFVVGHNLVWQAQTPDWVFINDQGKPPTRRQLLALMRDHIFTVVGRYKGRIKGWDVVNEAVDERGKLRMTPWRKIIGDDYIQAAFQFAHEADPNAELYYNDYGLENPAKRAGALALVKKLQAAGVKITGIGLQGHYQLATNSPTLHEVDDTITASERLGLKVMVTELDIDVLPSAWAALSADVSLRAKSDPKLNPYSNGLPAAVQAQLAARYAELFQIFLKHRGAVERVTFWGVTDGDSWLNGWPVAGRTSYPLLFDREGNPKPAFYSVLALAQKGHAPRSDAKAFPVTEQAANSTPQTISK